MSIWLDILCLILLILLNGFFAMSEISIVTARRSKLQMLADQGASGAELALSLSENPTRALSTIQVGITSIGILSHPCTHSQTKLHTPGDFRLCSCCKYRAYTYN